MNTLSFMEKQEALYHHLGKGRLPFASAELSGGERHPNVRGRIEFYATPAGTLILAEAQGLPGVSGTGRRSAVYEFYVKGQSESAHTYRCPQLPTLYEKEGRAWGSVVTAKLSVSDLHEKRLVLYQKEDVGEAWTDSAVETAVGTVSFAAPIVRRRTPVRSSAEVS